MSATACDRLQTEPLYRENLADIRKNRSAPGGGAPATAAWGRALQYEALKIRRYKGLFVIFALYLRVLRAWARDNQAVNLTEAHVTGGNETVIRPSSSAADSGCKVTPSGSSAVLVR